MHIVNRPISACCLCLSMVLSACGGGSGDPTELPPEDPGIVEDPSTVEDPDTIEDPGTNDVSSLTAGATITGALA